MEITEIMELSTQYDVGGKLLDIVIIILWLCGRKKTAEELQAQKEKRLARQRTKTSKAVARAQQEAQKEANLEKEIKK